MSGNPNKKSSVETFLEPTGFIDTQSPAIRAVVDDLNIAGAPAEKRAGAVFDYVRDRIEYDFRMRLKPEEYVASCTLNEGRGFCVRKAVVLCALGRAVGIPTALVFADMRDHTLPQKVTEALGTDVMHHHGLNAFYLGDNWVLVDASLSPRLVEKKGYRLTRFDGANDALQSDTTVAGERHMEYLTFYGRHADLPFKEMMAAMQKGYENSNPTLLKELGLETLP